MYKKYSCKFLRWFPREIERSKSFNIITLRNHVKHEKIIHKSNIFLKALFGDIGILPKQKSEKIYQEIYDDNIKKGHLPADYLASYTFSNIGMHASSSIS